ncbi:glycosyltransferase family 2 protein [Lactococcus lactis]|uniref:glycosyltransferase family 2 protein n=1 Tax=Lactococcus lactis TaxID=1358 RepID=UPI0022E71367|nr:glycosyltransferase family 2 protein [Lactococcus lactis]MDT2909231.1 glycosyltransferase family 2 protein [Lactococcus lactis]MDT2925239.1 glycosyltransferase family 2 protein [Lactococcus lactis]MDT2952098.1 glycosyltransferase family 2 protein [Lactococcus lactis]
MNNPKVSVVVPIYNQERYLRDCLDSLEAQTLEEIEFILINDGSKDSSIDIMNEYAAKNSKFIVVDKGNDGVGKTINIGIDMAKGEYIAELDSDDFAAADMYEKLYEVAKKNDVDIVKSSVNNFIGEGENLNVYFKEEIARKGYYNRVINPLEEKEVFTFKMYAWCSLYRRELLQDNKIIWNEDVSAYNDNGFYWQTMSFAKSVYYVEDYFNYHRRDNEHSTVRDSNKMFNNFFAEHAFIADKLIKSGTFEGLKKYFFSWKLDNYYFALTRIEFERKQDFFQLVAKDFRKDIEEYGLNAVHFVNQSQKIKINAIVKDPIQYFYTDYLKQYYKVSVVVPVHNSANYIRQTIESLLTQTLYGLEIILVENGSTDNTLEILKEYEGRDWRIQLHSIGASDAGTARNYGLERAHGQYIIFLDADDIFYPTMIAKAYNAGVKDDAEVIWFKTAYKDLLSGQTNPYNNFFNVAQMPNHRPFSFKQLKWNPYKAFNGWAWDKMFKTDYVRANNLTFQSLPVANDGYFTYLAMANAQRITTVNEILQLHIIGHGNNISFSKHDENYRNDYDMILEIIKELRKFDDENASAHLFLKSMLPHMEWMMQRGYKTQEALQKYFNLLVSGGLEELGFFEILSEENSASDQEVIDRFEQVLDYHADDFDKFMLEVGNHWIGKERNRLNYIPNAQVQQRNGKIIFGQNASEAQNTAGGLFAMIIPKKDTENVTAVVEMLFLADNGPAVKDTLNLSFAINANKEGEMQSNVFQAEWANGEKVMTDNIYYTYIDNVFTVYVKYTGKYTGFEYIFSNATSRSFPNKFSVLGINTGYITTIFPEVLSEMKRIEATHQNYHAPALYGQRTVFRYEGTKEQSEELLCVELPNYAFNNVVFALEIANIPNNHPAIYDTLYFGFFLDSDKELQANVFQAEWEKGRHALMDNVYYRVEGNKVYIGVRFTEIWAAYHFKLKSIVGRELNQDYSVNYLAQELVEKELSALPKDAQFIKEVQG